MMRRKYDLRNKKNFIIILILAILVICIFSLFIYRYTLTSKVEYVIEASGYIQDTNKNYLKIDDEARLKKNFNGNYYLVYQDKKINFGKKIVVFNELTGKMKLYGEMYEIQSDGKIVKNQEETLLANTTNTKFYKLSDRSYLLVDREITSSDKSVSASGYLLVELDKMGNAKLSNNKINLKTITPTTLITSKYRFDINNELLNYGGYDIDLKKIIGTTNEYKPDEKDNDKEEDTDNNSSNNAWNNGSGVSGGNVIINNGSSSGDNNSIGEIKDKTKMTSVIRVNTSLTQFDVDYVVYDPYNEYKSVYVEIVKNGKVEVIYLSKNDTHMVIDNLLPDTEYQVSFVYTTIDEESGEIVRNTFERLDLRTKKPVYSIDIYKVSSVDKILTYKINLQDGYKINQVLVNISFDYYEVDSETSLLIKKRASIDNVISVSGDSKYIMGSTSIDGYSIDRDTLIKLTVKSVSGSNGTIDINNSSSFRFGR